ncbi:MAG TPA: hypothetical protein VG248_03720 [Caulobacteraceae bacterium]|nr:hypothetical protein [Caulobacteraceae bacterium]
MAKLLLEALRQHDRQSNLSSDDVALTDGEAAELLSLLEALISDRFFQTASRFVEGMTLGRAGADSFREIYLAERRRTGRLRVMASRQWAEFLDRLGLTQHYEIAARPMSFSIYLKLEQQLLREAGINPRIIALVVRFMSQYQSTIERVRTGKRSIPAGTIVGHFRQLIVEVRGDAHGNREVAVRKLVGAISLVADLGVIFTTRDWSVAGTISAMAGAVIAGVA